MGQSPPCHTALCSSPAEITDENRLPTHVLHLDPVRHRSFRAIHTLGPECATVNESSRLAFLLRLF